jgi:hypothetical protein
MTEARRKVCHQQQQGQSLEKLFECKLCGKTAWPKSNLTKHILVRHQDQTEQRDNIGIEEYIAVKHSAAYARKSISREYLNSEQVCLFECRCRCRCQIHYKFIFRNKSWWKNLARINIQIYNELMSLW